MPSSPHFLAPLVADPAGRFALVAAGRPAVVATEIEPAFESAARKRGLLGRAALAAGTALVIAPCSAVHTFRMQFAIDMVFVARDGEVLKIRRGVKAGRVAGALRAFAVIEMAAGGAARSGVAVGDRLAVVRDPAAGTASTGSDRSPRGSG